MQTAKPTATRRSRAGRRRNADQPAPAAQTRPEPHRVRLPGFITDQEIGLGDVVKRITYAAGMRPCGGCNRRAAALNRWMVFTR
jgi:hypothetical protein